MKIFGQNLKTIQKHPKEHPETQKKFFSSFPPFLGFFYKKLNFGPQFGGEPQMLLFFQLETTFGNICSSASQKKGKVWGKMVTYIFKKPLFIMQKAHFNPVLGIFPILQ